MELMHLISMYAASHILMMYCFDNERPLAKMKPRLWTVPENSTLSLVLLREIVCGCGKVMLLEDDDEKEIALVLLFFSLRLFFFHP